jgi:predicted RNase H-like nuclease
MIHEPKKEIFDKLSEIDNVVVYQTRPNIIETFPCVTFKVLSNVPMYSLTKNIEQQGITVQVDIWASNSNETSAILKLVERKMSEINYLLTFNTDIEDEDGYSRLSLQFNY